MKKRILLIGLTLLTSLTLASCGDPSYPFLNTLVEKHTVTFFDVNGNVLLEEEVYNHQNYVYNGEIPTKESTNIYSYTFSGWDESLDNITKDTEFKPLFNETKRTYKVTFLNDDNTILWETTVQAGESVEYDESTHTIPSRLPDETNTWEWAGTWHIEDNNGVSGSTMDYVISDLVLKPDFKASTIQYTVRFFDDSGNNILYETVVDAGSYVTYEGPIPTKDDELSSDGETKTVYTFAGWDKTLAETLITADTNFVAQFESETLPSDRAVVRDFILDNYNSSYDKDTYNYVLLANNYYLGYSNSRRDFNLRVEKDAFSILLIDNHVYTPKITLSISFDYNDLKDSTVVGNFEYFINEEIGSINTRFNVSSYGEPPMITAPKNLDHDGAENNQALASYIPYSDNELNYAISMLSMNAATYFANNSLPYLY